MGKNQHLPLSPIYCASWRPRDRSHKRFYVLLICARLGMTGCGRTEIEDQEKLDGPPSAPQCVDQLDIDQFILQCTPLYEPTWTNIYEFEFKPHTAAQAQSGCGQPGLACHGQGQVDDKIVAGAGAATGLSFTGDAATAHSILLDSSPNFVDPNNLACSPLVVRLHLDNSTYWMPPGPQPYDSRRRCSILRWIAQGAIP